MTPEDRVALAGRLCKHPLASLSNDVLCVACATEAVHAAIAEASDAILARVNAVLAEARADAMGTDAEHVVDELQDDIPAAIRAATRRT